MGIAPNDNTDSTPDNERHYTISIFFHVAIPCTKMRHVTVPFPGTVVRHLRTVTTPSVLLSFIFTENAQFS